MYKNKYIKYKNKYINLKNQLGGECNPLPKMTDSEHITLDEYGNRSPNERITIHGLCYFVDELFNWIINLNNNETPYRTQVSDIDRQRIINAYNILHPNNPYIVQPIQQHHINTLQNAPLPNHVTEVDDELVLTIPRNVAHIDDNMYANSMLARVNIPNSVTHIGNSAFANNVISDLRIPTSVIEIGDNAFANNYLTRVIIPRRFNNTRSKLRIFGDIPLGRTNFIYLD